MQGCPSSPTMKPPRIIPGRPTGEPPRARPPCQDTVSQAVQGVLKWTPYIRSQAVGEKFRAAKAGELAAARARACGLGSGAAGDLPLHVQARLLHPSVQILVGGFSPPFN